MMKYERKKRVENGPIVILGVGFGGKQSILLHVIAFESSQAESMA